MFGRKDILETPVIENSVVVYHHEDFTADAISEHTVGRKGLSLFKIQDMDVPIPSFFVVSPTAYKNLLFTAFDTNIMALLEKDIIPKPEELAKFIFKYDFDIKTKEEILRAYSRISGFSDAWVSVRSSVVFPDNPEISFSGVFGTELNVKGFDDLLEAIKQVYASIFTDKVAAYVSANGIGVSQLQMAIVVQRMIQAEVSGTALTVDPITSDEHKMSIEAVYGLGDVIANGEITPDQYIINKQDLAIIEKHISPQEWMKVRRVFNKKTDTHFGCVEKVQISSLWSHKQKLEDRHLEEIAKIALIIEESSKEPCEVEWVWESGNVWVLQSKHVAKSNAQVMDVASFTLPSRAANESLLDLAVEIVKSRKTEDKVLIDALRQVKKQDRELIEEEILQEEKEPTMVGKDLASMFVDNIIEDKPAISEVIEDLPVQSDDIAADTQSPASEENPEAVEMASKNAYEDLQSEIARLQQLAEKMKVINKKEEIAEEKVIEKEVEEQEEHTNEIVGNEKEENVLQLVASGSGVSFGEVTGEIKKYEGGSVLKGFVTSKTVLLIRGYTLDMQPYIMSAGGVIIDTGGLTSDVAVLCRELGIPSVVASGEVYDLLVDGDIVKIDGSFGSIYKYVPATQVEEQIVKLTEKEKIVEKYVPVVNTIEETKVEKDLKASHMLVVDDIKVAPAPAPAAKSDVSSSIVTATKVYFNSSFEYLSTNPDILNTVSYSDGVVFISLDDFIIEHKQHPLASVEDGTFKDYANGICTVIDEIADKLSPKEIVLAIGTATQSQFNSLVRASKFEDESIPLNMSGISRYLKNPATLKRVLMIVRRLRNIYRDRNISLGVYSPLSGANMIEVKKEISALGLRRTATFNIYAILAKPSELILADDILAAELDGIILDTPALACDIQGLDKSDPTSAYDLGATSVFKMITAAVTTAARESKRVIVMCEDNKTLIKQCVRAGVFGISTCPDSLRMTKELVASEESKLILGN